MTDRELKKVELSNLLRKIQEFCNENDFKIFVKSTDGYEFSIADSDTITIFDELNDL